MTVVFQLSRSAVCDCHKMNKAYKERVLYYKNLVNGTSTPAAPQALPPNANQHRDNIVRSASERRTDLTTSASGFSFGGSATSVQFGSTPTRGPSFGGSATSDQSGFGGKPSVSFEGPSTFDQSGFGGKPSVSFEGPSTFDQSGFGGKPSVSFGGPSTFDQSGFGGKPSVSCGGSATSGQSGFDVTPKQPPPPRTDSTRVFMSREDFDKILVSKENETDENRIDLTTGEKSNKRKSDAKSEDDSKKKIKSDGLPQFAGKGLFQYVYMVFKNSTGVKQTNVEANPIWGLVTARRTYFEKLAIAFKNDCLQNGVTKGSSFDKKRNALAKRLSEIPDMCTDEEGKWKAPTQSHEALFK